MEESRTHNQRKKQSKANAQVLSEVEGEEKMEGIGLEPPSFRFEQNSPDSQRNVDGNSDPLQKKPNSLFQADRQYTQGENVKGPQVSQFRRAKRKKKHPAPTLASPRAVQNEVLEDLDIAQKKFLDAANETNNLIDAMLKQANQKAIHQEAESDWKQALDDVRRSKRKSKLEQVFEAVSTIANFSASVYSVYKAGQAILTSAKELRTAHKRYKMFKDLELTGVSKDERKKLKKSSIELAKQGVKAGKGAHKAGKEVSGVFASARIDPGVLLAKTNAQAIQRGHQALDRYVNSQLQFNMLQVYNKGTDAGQRFAHGLKSLNLITVSDQMLSESDLNKVENLLSKIHQHQRSFDNASKRMKQIWKAYRAGGAASMKQGSRGLSMFEKIAEWVRTGDPKAKAIHVAMDQKVQHIEFTGTGTRKTGGNLWKKKRYFYKYKTRIQQVDTGALFITNPDVKKELKGLLVKKIIPISGSAEKKMIKDLTLGPDAERFTTSHSMCKALMSLGINWTKLDATTRFHQGKDWREIEEFQATDIHDHWWKSDEFTTFWKDVLGGRFAYIGKSASSLKTISGATSEAFENSDEIYDIR
ncbi:MAG: hypothetical protein AAF587_20530 [Bacteroidota bacterium]